MADKSGKPIRVIAWCTPRTVSTALAKCIGAIEGMDIWYEPYHHCCLARDMYHAKYSGVWPLESHEDNKGAFVNVLELLEGCGFPKFEPDRIVFGNVKRGLEETTSRYVFVKDVMSTHPDEDFKNYIPSGFQHVFLIRDPILVFNSFRNAKYKMLRDSGVLQGDALDENKFDIQRDDANRTSQRFFKFQHDLWKHIREKYDPDPIVINTHDLLANPAGMLSKFCELTGLPYSESLLHWDASTDLVKQWRVAADNLLYGMHGLRLFYNSGVTSSQFLPPNKAIPRDQVPEDVLRLADAAMPYYNEMNRHKLEQ